MPVGQKPDIYVPFLVLSPRTGHCAWAHGAPLSCACAIGKRRYTHVIYTNMQNHYHYNNLKKEVVI